MPKSVIFGDGNRESVDLALARSVSLPLAMM
jgi:hypothetical protein